MPHTPPSPTFTRDYLAYHGQKIEYVRFGSGDRILCCFHGFADQAGLFLPLEPSLGTAYTVYTFSLPYHGSTEWHQPTYTKADLIYWIEMVLVREKKERLSLLGFSMGGKIAMCLLETLAHKVDQVILLAPDGLKTHYLYDVVKFPTWTKRLVYRGLEHPKWFFSIASLAKRLGLLTKFLYDFLYNHLSTVRRRQRLFQTWDSLDGFVPDLPLIKSQLTQREIPLIGIFGERDQVIPPAAGKILAQGMSQKVQIITVAKGHLLVDQDLNPILSAWLKEQMHTSDPPG